MGRPDSWNPADLRATRWIAIALVACLGAPALALADEGGTEADEIARLYYTYQGTEPSAEQLERDVAEVSALLGEGFAADGLRAAVVQIHREIPGAATASLADIFPPYVAGMARESAEPDPPPPPSPPRGGEDAAMVFALDKVGDIERRVGAVRVGAVLGSVFYFSGTVAFLPVAINGIVDGRGIGGDGGTVPRIGAALLTTGFAFWTIPGLAAHSGLGRADQGLRRLGGSAYQRQHHKQIQSNTVLGSVLFGSAAIMAFIGSNIVKQDTYYFDLWEWKYDGMDGPYVEVTDEGLTMHSDHWAIPEARQDVALSLVFAGILPCTFGVISSVAMLTSFTLMQDELESAREELQARIDAGAELAPVEPRVRFVAVSPWVDPHDRSYGLAAAWSW